ncbi:MAG: NAD(P)H-dependent oxidoreductase [Pyramidobacter sp.]|nr:NAD(P)H-dependent oxidoreductase [Pyramidobacter sp.]
MSKLLVAYFSKSGVTKAAAEKIARVGDGTLFEIVTEKKYPAGYAATVIVAKKEQLVHELPAIVSHVDDFESYDTVALGFPVWWFTCPRVILTFLTQ